MGFTFGKISSGETVLVPVNVIYEIEKPLSLLFIPPPENFAENVFASITTYHIYTYIYIYTVSTYVTALM